MSLCEHLRVATSNGGAVCENCQRPLQAVWMTKEEARALRSILDHAHDVDYRWGDIENLARALSREGYGIWHSSDLDGG
jgi:hypothetical protein